MRIVGIVTITLTGLALIAGTPAHAQQVAQSGSMDMPSTSPGAPPAVRSAPPASGSGAMPETPPPPPQAISCVTPSFSCAIGPGPIGVECWCSSNGNTVTGISR